MHFQNKQSIDAIRVLFFFFAYSPTQKIN